MLTIRNVDESARGRYQCTITIAAGVSGTGFVDLQVSSSSTRSTKLSGLFTLLDSDSDSDYCTMQKFPIGSDSDSDPLIEK